MQRALETLTLTSDVAASEDNIIGKDYKPPPRTFKHLIKNRVRLRLRVGLTMQQLA